MKKVSEIMTMEIVSTPGDTPIKEAAERTVEKEVGSIAVTDDGVPVGIVTEKDFVKYLASGRGAEYIGDIMSAPLIRVEPDADISEALKAMNENDIKHIFVEEKKESTGFDFGEILGIVSVKDVLKNLLDQTN
jgi:CBS domain-containing protein